MRVYKVQVEQTRGENKGSIQILIIREQVDGKIAVPGGYRLIAIIGEVKHQRPMGCLPQSATRNQFLRS